MGNWKAQLRDWYMDRLSELCVNILILVIGVLFTCVGFGWKEGAVKSATIGIGCSLTVSAVVALLSLLYIFKRQKEREITEHWGVIGVYRTRGEMNAACDKSIGRTVGEIDMIGFGFGSLRNAQGTRIEEKVKNGLKLRILTMHPESIYTTGRDLAEHKVEGHTGHSIVHLAMWVEKLRAMAPDRENVQIRFYDAMPLDFLFCTDDRLYCGPYLYGKDSQSTISYEFSRGGEACKYYMEHFEFLWNDADPESVPKRPFEIPDDQQDD